jgi:hypothetical protein
MRPGLIVTVLAAVFLAIPHLAFANDAGDGGSGIDGGLTSPIGDSGGDATSLGEGSDSGNAGPSAEPLACDGSLCDTTNGAECAVHGGAPRSRPVDEAPVVLALFVVALWAGRCRRGGASRPGATSSSVAVRLGARRRDRTIALS